MSEHVNGRAVLGEAKTRWASPAGSRTQPCEAGYSGTCEYSCIAIPPTKYEAHGIHTWKGYDQDIVSLR